MGRRRNARALRSPVGVRPASEPRAARVRIHHCGKLRERRPPRALAMCCGSIFRTGWQLSPAAVLSPHLIAPSNRGRRAHGEKNLAHSWYTLVLSPAQYIAIRRHTDNCIERGRHLAYCTRPPQVISGCRQARAASRVIRPLCAFPGFPRPRCRPTGDVVAALAGDRRAGAFSLFLFDRQPSGLTVL